MVLRTPGQEAWNLRKLGQEAWVLRKLARKLGSQNAGTGSLGSQKAELFAPVHKIATLFLLQFRGGKNVFSLKCCLEGHISMLFHGFLPFSGVAKMCFSQNVAHPAVNHGSGTFFNAFS
ncbi:MAG: hypothetical protein IKG00_02835 [Lachnospiraceae bacterium]|nr:hypothetical protein [Lachnospiraceae bacterium]